MGEWLDELERLSVIADLPSDVDARRDHLWRIEKVYFDFPASETEDKADFFGELMTDLAVGQESGVREDRANFCEHCKQVFVYRPAG